MTMQVELVSPERILYSGEAEMVTARTAGGDISFLTGHAPFVGALGIGVVTIRQTQGGDLKAAVHGGFVEVKDNRVTILSDVAELPDQVDTVRAKVALEGAQKSGDADAMRRAQVRLEVAGAGTTTGAGAH